MPNVLFNIYKNRVKLVFPPPLYKRRNGTSKSWNNWNSVTKNWIIGLWFQPNTKILKSIVMSWTVASLKINAGLLLLRPSVCNCIWRQGLRRGNPVKMKSLVWALIQDGQCPYKMRTFGPRDMHVGTPCEDESWDQYEVSASLGTPKIASKPSQNRVIG